MKARAFGMAGLWVVGLIAGGCSGQTGDPGIDQDACEPQAFDGTVAEAEARGFSIRSENEAAIDWSGLRQVSLLAVLPATFWTDLGMEPPATRSTRIELRTAASDRVTFIRFSEDPTWRAERPDAPPPECRGEAVILHGDVVFDFPELDHSVTGLAVLDRGAARPEILSDEFGKCDVWQTARDGRLQLDCERLSASTDCLEERALRTLPTEAASGMRIDALVEKLHHSTPVEVECVWSDPQSGQALSSAWRDELTFTARMPDSYCVLPRQEANKIPAVAEFSLAGTVQNTDTSADLWLVDDGESGPRGGIHAYSAMVDSGRDEYGVGARVSEDGAWTLHAFAIRHESSRRLSCSGQKALAW